MISCLLRIHSLRFFDGGLHEVPVEEVMTVALIAIFIFVPCLWLVRYLKDKRLDSDEKDKFIQIHIISTIVLTILKTQLLRYLIDCFISIHQPIFGNLEAFELDILFK